MKRGVTQIPGFLAQAQNKWKRQAASGEGTEAEAEENGDQVEPEVDPAADESIVVKDHEKTAPNHQSPPTDEAEAHPHNPTHHSPLPVEEDEEESSEDAEESEDTGPEPASEYERVLKEVTLFDEMVNNDTHTDSKTGQNLNIDQVFTQMFKIPGVMQGARKVRFI